MEVTTYTSVDYINPTSLDGMSAGTVCMLGATDTASVYRTSGKLGKYVVYSSKTYDDRNTTTGFVLDLAKRKVKITLISGTGQTSDCQGGVTQFIIDGNEINTPLIFTVQWGLSVCVPKTGVEVTSYGIIDNATLTNYTSEYYRIAVAGDAGRYNSISSNTTAYGGGISTNGATQTSGYSFGVGQIIISGSNTIIGGNGWYGGTASAGLSASWYGGTGAVIGKTVTTYPSGFMGDDTELISKIENAIDDDYICEQGTAYTYNTIKAFCDVVAIEIISVPSTPNQTITYRKVNNDIKPGVMFVYTENGFKPVSINYWNGTEFLSNFGLIDLPSSTDTSDTETTKHDLDIYFTLPNDNMTIPLYFSAATSIKYNIDWGDGSSEEAYGNGGQNYAPNKIAEHTYTSAGDYVISIDVLETPVAGFGGLICGRSASDWECSYMFGGLYDKYITKIVNRTFSASSTEWAFSEMHNLKEIYSEEDIFGYSAFQFSPNSCSLEKIIINNTNMFKYFTRADVKDEEDLYETFSGLTSTCGLYVNPELVDSYKASSDWTSIFGDRIYSNEDYLY